MRPWAALGGFLALAAAAEVGMIKPVSGLPNLGFQAMASRGKSQGRAVPAARGEQRPAAKDEGSLVKKR